VLHQPDEWNVQKISDDQSQRFSRFLTVRRNTLGVYRQVPAQYVMKVITIIIMAVNEEIYNTVGQEV
jgi:hypothetical protein